MTRPPRRHESTLPTVASAPLGPSRWFLRRLTSSLFLLFLLLSSTFFIIQLAPGEPVRLFEDPRIPAERRAEIRRSYGLDRPLGEQYIRWGTSVLQGDWGTSFTSGRPATRILAEKLPNSMLLILSGVAIEHLVGIALGIAAASRRGRVLDQGLRVSNLFLFSIPPFVLALLAIEIFSVHWAWFPTGQMRSDRAQDLSFFANLGDLLHHLFLPAMTLGLSRSAPVMRFVRTGLLETLNQDFIRFARAKGLSMRQVLWTHALRNALTPLIQRLGVSLPLLFSSTLILEVIFSWPGLGTSMFVAVSQRDYPVILASTALVGSLVILGNFLADLCHAAVDPRVRRA